MKVFISHKSVDASIAAAIAARLRSAHDIECYLDVVDPNLSEKGEDLGEYLRSEIGKCSQLIAVVSERTKNSWWVPWEIGIATEKSFPLASFVGDDTAPPKFLAKWPLLKSLADVDKYAAASKAADTDFRVRKAYLAEDTARVRSTHEFYRIIRKSLGQ
ncbi:MAG TPA: TIR domain-containing protein [Rhizomicrobium sp.]|nr:TIR domain-containing protein [Rhizomicrobium sp.]